MAQGRHSAILGLAEGNSLAKEGPTLIVLYRPLISVSALPTAFSQWKALVGGWRQEKRLPPHRPVGESVARLQSLAPTRAPWACMVPAVWDMGLAQWHHLPLSLSPGVLLGSCGCFPISHLTSQLSYHLSFQVPGSPSPKPSLVQG